MKRIRPSVQMQQALTQSPQAGFAGHPPSASSSPEPPSSCSRSASKRRRRRSSAGGTTPAGRATSRAGGTATTPTRSRPRPGLSPSAPRRSAGPPREQLGLAEPMLAGQLHGITAAEQLQGHGRLADGIQRCTVKDDSLIWHLVVESPQFVTVPSYSSRGSV